MKLLQVEDDKNVPIVGLEDIVLKATTKIGNTGALGIVGIGGSGKTRLAKIIHDHVQHEYDATCFIKDLKNQSDNLHILNEILKEIGIQTKARSLKYGHQLLKESTRKRKTLFILDGVRDEGQVEFLLPQEYIKVDSNCHLILTTRNWSFIKNHVMEIGRVDVPKLNGFFSMQLFLMHAFEDEKRCPLQYDCLAQKIVQACDGLPLSLEIMGTFLCGKPRIRTWEWALQRLLRARSLGVGDENEMLTNLRSLRLSFDEAHDTRGSIHFQDKRKFFKCISSLTTFSYRWKMGS